MPAIGPSAVKRIHIPHVVDVPRPQDVVDADDVLVVKAQQDLDLPQRALAVRLVLEGADFLDGDALAGHVIQRRAAGWRERQGSRVTPGATCAQSQGEDSETRPMLMWGVGGEQRRLSDLKHCEVLQVWA